MDVETIIKELAALSGPNRRVDKVLFDFVASLQGAPNLTDVQNIPHFTAGMNVAYNLVQMVAPDSVGGVSWNKAGGRAQVADLPICDGANPAIALCIAALKAYQNQPR